MSLRWLKPYVPRGLYGRTTLILLTPVITVLLVVSVVFVERHFDDVTQQMVSSMAREVQLVLDDPQDVRARDVLQITLRQVTPDEIPKADERALFDVSGGVVIREFRKHFDRLERISLADEELVQLYFREGDQVANLIFDRRRVSARRPYKLLVNTLFFAVLMTVIAHFYLRKQVRPITRLAEAAEAFGRGRHIAYRASGATEVRAAGRAFLDMRARIERQIEQRTMMLSGVSHDLRTPLTRLKLGLSMLDDEEAAPMRQDVEEMQRLLDAFLDFARGDAEDEPQMLDPLALVRQVVEDAQRAGLPVTLAGVEGEGEMALRPLGIRRALENLIGNAVRYGTRAEVTATLTERLLRIRIEDDGPGIPEAQREEAMKPFSRLEPARNQNRGAGVGLGLAITMDVARAHGGALRLSDSPRLGGLCAELTIAR